MTEKFSGYDFKLNNSKHSHNNNVNLNIIDDDMVLKGDNRVIEK